MAEGVWAGFNFSNSVEGDFTVDKNNFSGFKKSWKEGTESGRENRRGTRDKCISREGHETGRAAAVCWSVKRRCWVVATGGSCSGRSKADYKSWQWVGETPQKEDTIKRKQAWRRATERHLHIGQKLYVCTWTIGLHVLP